MSLLSILLQVDTVTKAAGAATAEPEKISLFYLLKEGGVLMIPLLLCSIALVYVFVERLSAIKKASVVDPSFMSRIREQIMSGNLNAAKSLAKNYNSPVARMIDKGIFFYLHR